MDALYPCCRRLFALLAVYGLLQSTVWPWAPNACADPEATAHYSDDSNLILLAPAHPVFIQFRVQVDGRGLKAVRAAYAATLFDQYDRDGDALLDRDEARAMPPLVKSANASETVSIADRWEAVDRDPADDKVSLDELAAYIDRIFGGTFLLSMKPQRATQSIDLFAVLDRNRDGKLSHEELDAAPEALHKLDLDDDETFTIDELLPYRNPQVPQVPAVPGNQATDQPFMLLADDESIARAVQQLQQRYGSAHSRGSAPQLDRASLGLDAAVFASHDVDRDGTLDGGELTTFLRNPVAHVVIEAQLPQAKAGKPKLSVAQDRLGAVSKNTPGGAGKLSLAMSGLAVEFKAATVRARNDASDNRNFRKTKFLEADRDKNKYISQEEFAGLNLPDADFKAVDRNGDGMIVLDELLAFVEQESASSQSRIELSISHDGKSVFEVIDANSDRRISRRELAQAFDRLRKFDLDGDGSIAAAELVGRFQGTLEFGRPTLFRGSGAAPRGDTTAPIVSAPTAGPEWFRKMDRNRDGDVSQREFLGPPATFKKLDADGDGLITAAEAEMAGERTKAAER
jgi:Ca2+-binding EF-hand superfamily protein